jgi:predicted Zn finger-like uncharacterized protein
MQLACPACAAIYNVPDSMIGEGRMIHCARCAHEWFALPLLKAALPEPVPAPAMPEASPAPPEPRAPIALAPPPPPPRMAEAPPPPEPKSLQSQLLLRLAWVASLGLVAWGGYFVWTERARMTELWPPIARLYGLFGA